MIKNKGGSIIAISSIASERYVGYPSISYNASKGAINQIIQNMLCNMQDKTLEQIVCYLVF